MIAPTNNPQSSISDFTQAGDMLLIGKHWRIRRGISHGLRQPALMVEIRVLDAAPKEMEVARKKLEAWCKFPILQANQTEQCGPLDLISAWAQTLIGLQRELGQAIDHKTNTWRISGKNDPKGWMSFKLLVPSPTPSLTIKIASWLCGELMKSYATVDSLVLAKEQLFLDLQQQLPKSLNSESITDAALRLEIPYFRIHQAGDIQILGLGCKARWLQSTKSHNTSALGLGIARSKQLTATILRAFGLPGAAHKLVHSGDNAIQAAESLGFPVVVKPENLDRGVGVQAGLLDAKSVRDAYELARKHSERVLVERHCPGLTHRISVFNRRIVRVSKRIPGGVMGDGRSNVRDLVRLEQQTPHQTKLRQRHGHYALELDDEALGLLEHERLSLDDIPALDRYVRLRRRDNINAGGKNELVSLDRVHVDNIELSLTVADLLGLDFAGVDLIIQDIGQSWRSTPALICEVNAVPQLGTATDPDSYLTILRDMFPKGWRIPSQLVIVPEDPVVRAQELGRCLVNKPGFGISDCSGLMVAGQSVSLAFSDGHASAQALLIRPDVVNAICLMSPKEILQIGTPLAWWDSVRVSDSHLFSEDERHLLIAALRILAPHYPSNQKVSSPL